MTKEAQEAVAIKAVALIEESGFPITLTHEVGASYDPDTGPVVGITELSQGFAIETEWEVDSVPTSIATSVKKVILAVQINEPIVNKDTLTFKNETYKVLGSEPLETGEVRFFYTLFLGE
jgi:hypothetical protein